MAERFRDRSDAGRRLAPLLAHYAGRADLLVLALPRGGVPVAAGVAAALDAPLDVLVVRKVGWPAQPEVALAAIASGGSTMRAAARALRQLRPARLVVAVPVAAAETCRAMRREADEVVCALTPEPFFAVGLWYDDFTQTSDDEVRELLAGAALVERHQR